VALTQEAVSIRRASKRTKALRRGMTGGSMEVMVEAIGMRKGAIDGVIIVVLHISISSKREKISL
jgi:hypothetical protein